MWMIQAIMIGILITMPTGFAIVFCSYGNAANKREIYRLTKEIERLEQRHRTDLHSTMTIYAAHETEIADLRAQHEAECERLGKANATEFARGVEWERKKPERETRAARWAAKMEAEHAKLAAEWRS